MSQMPNTPHQLSGMLMQDPSDPFTRGLDASQQAAVQRNPFLASSQEGQHWQDGYSRGVAMNDARLHCLAASVFNYTLFAI